jgi:hypothetical protein
MPAYVTGMDFSRRKNKTGIGIFGVADLVDCTEVLTPLLKTPSVINTRASH